MSANHKDLRGSPRGSRSSRLVEQFFTWIPPGSRPEDRGERVYHYTVYMPPGYHKRGEPCQLLILLHGANGDHRNWAQEGGVQATMDALLAQGKIQPMVVVMPGHRHGWWVDGKRDMAQTPLLRELLPRIRGLYAVRSDRESTLIAGNSAGGHAAVRLALMHPEIFGAAAAISPAVYAEVPASSSANKDGQFSIATGEPADPATWRAYNYPTYLASYRSQSLRVPFFVATGDRDRFGICKASGELRDALLDVQTQVGYQEYPGCHEWSVFGLALIDAVQYLSSAYRRSSTLLRAV